MITSKTFLIQQQPTVSDFFTTSVDMHTLPVWKSKGIIYGMFMRSGLEVLVNLFCWMEKD